MSGSIELLDIVHVEQAGPNELMLSHTSLVIPPMSTFPITITAATVDRTVPAGYQLRITSNDPDAESTYTIDVAINEKTPAISTAVPSEQPVNTTASRRTR